eukprot:403363688
MENTLVHHYEKNEGYYNLCVFILGFVDYLGFFVINAFTQQLADDFDRNYFFCVFLVFLNALSCIARFTNALFFIRIQHVTRIMLNSVLMLTSYMLLTLAVLKYQGDYFSFQLSIVASLLHCFAQAFGETVLMGYLKGLPSDLIMTFGAGTGLAGFTDCFTVLFLTAVGVISSKGLLILGLSVIPFYMSFMWIDDKRNTYIKTEHMYPEMWVQSPVKSDGLFGQASASPGYSNRSPVDFKNSRNQFGSIAEKQMNQIQQQIENDKTNINNEEILEVQVQVEKDPFQVNQEENYSPNHEVKMRKAESRMLKEYDDVQDNKRLSLVSTIQVFQKAGSYIIHNGLVNFLEYLVINLMLIIHTAKRESRYKDTSIEMTFLQENEYEFLMIAYYAGSFISRSTLHSKILSRSYTPTLAQLVNITFWIYNIKYEVMTEFYPTFFFMIWCGFPSGTAYSNFFYLANTRTNLDCDFDLHFTERELTVNLLFLANDLGIFFAGIIGFIIQAQYYPETLYNPPG